MRSIPVAMVWEMLHRGRWVLILGALGANLLPMIIFGALSRLGPIEMDEQAHRMFHSTIVQINMCIFGISVMAVQGTPARLYAFPIPTTTIVVWQMLPAMFLVGLEMVLSTAALNGLFHLGWPVWGPALFVAATLAAFQATIWYTEKTVWLPLVLPFVAGLLFYWHLWRFTPVLTKSVLPNMDIVPIEVVFLSLVVLTSYLVGVAGVARNRYGEQIKPWGIVAWLGRLLDFRPRFSPPFRSSIEAQFWYEWTLKGWGLPLIVAAGIFVTTVIWLFASRNPKELVDGLVTGGAMISVAGMVVGMLMGNLGRADSDFQIRQFLATRPLTSTTMAALILKVAAKSVLIAWVIWAVALAIVVGICIASGLEPHQFLSIEFRWWYLPATLVGCWTVVAVIASTLMTGRAKELVQLFCCLFASYIGLVIYTGFALTQDARLQLFRGLTVALGIGSVLCSAALFAIAFRRRLITLPIVAGGACAWMTIVSVVLFEWSRNRYQPASGFVLVIGLAALSVVPLAGAPLALSWNRNR